MNMNIISILHELSETILLSFLDPSYAVVKSRCACIELVSKKVAMLKMSC